MLGRKVRLCNEINKMAFVSDCASGLESFHSPRPLPTIGNGTEKFTE